ncbi:MAG: Mannose-1-phosphate guanylyltransferase [Candidatus Woesebacteria bacterium GW2011_GWA1_37_8]|uniref:Mannose-1-phosphate guanylyltransferase n=2 Tax=Candidatus Woeseibacteriota TaxID=1752722 RepID=A0A0G0NNK0_9BACT|nr:MAG: mannose-1-phosphate guanylyltransferase [Microgenomates group bacterium GW2011_GWC1_37_12b]KKQ46331.1 MAG: Mannose-1-phosphate guanylyltransferase [Candidatus Woesebacteria bacterium GW2011_GWA1_37_8]KKQ87489.1 MAG: Mannose-1-phosphate guanylyltransferase [Candidatus Woesebacteria bacterium GW2011_GWB1_38_8b]
MIPVIICGGFGTKLWPVSRQHKPKHFLSLIGEKSLFQLNYEALRTHFKPEDIYVSTNEDQANLAKKQVPEIPDDNFILEPEMRNQGPATGLIAAFLYKKGFKNEPFMLVQVDDLREPVESFIKMMLDCDVIARKENKYLTGGMRLDYPVMGVDYLMMGEKVSEGESVGIFKVERFIWRSTKEETVELTKHQGVLVHTNHTCMTPENLLNMLQKYKPEWYEPLMNFVNGADLMSEYLKMPAGPIEDVTQKVHAAGESLVVELPFKWYDIGTFETLHEYLKEKGLYKVSDNIVDLNGTDNYIRLDDPNKVVALVGVDNLIIVDTGDALLICDKRQTSRVGDALKEVKARELALT